MTNRSNDELALFPPTSRLFLGGAFAAQVLLLLVLLAWVGDAQEAVPASSPVASVRTPTCLPRALSSFGAAALDGWIYVYGGHTGRTHAYTPEAQSDAFVRLRADDPSVREELLGGARLQSAALVAAGGRVLSIGGMRAARAGERVELTSLADVRAFDPVTRAWSELPALPEPRSSHDAAVVGQRVLVFGGWNLAGNSDEATWLAHGLELDLARPEAGWRPLAQPSEQRGVAAVACAGEVVIFGGMDAEGDFSSAVDVFDPARNAWRKAPELPERGFGLAAAALGDRLFVAAPSGTVWELERAPERWVERGELFVPRRFHRMVAHADELIVLGGSADSRPVAWIERLVPGRNEVAARFELPLGTRARQRQALFVHEGVVHLFGGNVALEQHAFEPEDFLAEAWRVELGAGAASTLPPLPLPRQSMVCVDAGEEALYALGGFGHDGTRDRSFDEVWRCELASGEWRVLDVRLPRPMTQFRALHRDGRLLVVGGMDFDREREEKMQLLDAVYSADAAHLERGFGETDVHLPAPRRAFGAALLGDVLYLAGGLDASFEAVASFDAYDFATHEWRVLQPPETARLSPELVALGGKLYLCAGLVFDDKGRALPAEAIEEFDPARGAWRRLAAPLPLDPREVQAFAWHETLAFVSTWNERGVLELGLVDPRVAVGGP